MPPDAVPHPGPKLLLAPLSEAALWLAGVSNVDLKMVQDGVVDVGGLAVLVPSEFEGRMLTVGLRDLERSGGSAVRASEAVVFTVEVGVSDGPDGVLRLHGGLREAKVVASRPCHHREGRVTTDDGDYLAVLTDQPGVENADPVVPAIKRLRAKLSKSKKIPERLPGDQKPPVSTIGGNLQPGVVGGEGVVGIDGDLGLGPKGAEGRPKRRRRIVRRGPGYEITSLGAHVDPATKPSLASVADKVGRDRSKKPNIHLLPQITGSDWEPAARAESDLVDRPKPAEVVITERAAYTGKGCIGGLTFMSPQSARVAKRIAR